ncbi:MAG: HAD family hydrolase [Gemmataceae bacterium]|nr:HAD family hydrolase [Gemmataceae bacterium]
METESFLDWAARQPKRRALICDIDDTLCTGFDVPIAIACQVLARIDRSIEVHYVTARPEASRPGTERFLDEYRLPGRGNLHFCPTWKTTRTHKTEAMTRLAREYDVLVSIGDHDEDEAASRAAGVPFVRVGQDALEAVDKAWAEIAALINGG